MNKKVIDLDLSEAWNSESELACLQATLDNLPVTVDQQLIAGIRGDLPLEEILGQGRENISRTQMELFYVPEISTDKNPIDYAYEEGQPVIAVYDASKLERPLGAVEFVYQPTAGNTYKDAIVALLVCKR